MKNYLFLIAIFGVLVSCSHDHSDHDHHVEARGVVLFMGGKEIARLDSTNLRGSITILANQQPSEKIEVKFIADNATRDLFQPEGDKHWMQVTVSDTTIAGLVRETGAENKWKFQLRGKQADITDVKIQIYHIDHPDYTTSRNIPIVVNPVVD